MMLPLVFTLLGCDYAHVRTEPQCDIGHTRGKKDTAMDVMMEADTAETMTEDVAHDVSIAADPVDSKEHSYPWRLLVT